MMFHGGGSHSPSVLSFCGFSRGFDEVEAEAGDEDVLCDQDWESPKKNATSRKALADDARSSIMRSTLL